jgi:hypothetical protein
MEKQIAQPFFSSLWLATFGLTLFEEEVRAVGAAYSWLQPMVLLLVWLAGLFCCRSSTELLQVVQETMQPENINIWIKQS